MLWWAELLLIVVVLIILCVQFPELHYYVFILLHTIVSELPNLIKYWLEFIFNTDNLHKGYSFWITLAFCHITLVRLLALLEKFILTLHSYITAAKRFSWLAYGLNSLWKRRVFAVILLPLVVQAYLSIPLPGMSLEDEIARSLEAYRYISSYFSILITALHGVVFTFLVRLLCRLVDFITNLISLAIRGLARRVVSMFLILCWLFKQGFTTPKRAAISLLLIVVFITLLYL